MIVRDIIKTRLVSVQTLLAAMRLDLLIGIIFVLLYQFVGTVTQNGFFGSVSAGTITNYLSLQVHDRRRWAIGLDSRPPEGHPL